MDKRLYHIRKKMSLSGLSELRQSHMLVQEKLEQWIWFERFLALNPDVKERWEQYKTYEILKNE